MPFIAAADPVIVVALIAVALLVAVIAVVLIFIGRVLKQVSARLEAVVAAADEMPPELAPAEDVLERINADLKTGQELLDEPEGPRDAERG